MIFNLIEASDSEDVTHKLVLKACSPVFQSIMRKLSEQNPVILLRGVPFEVMKSILEFIYLEEATVYNDSIIEFYDVENGQLVSFNIV